MAIGKVTGATTLGQPAACAAALSRCTGFASPMAREKPTMLPRSTSIERGGVLLPSAERLKIPVAMAEPLGPFVQRDDARAAEANVVLQGYPGALDLPAFCVAAQLFGQLETLREPGCPKWVALGEKAA